MKTLKWANCYEKQLTGFIVPEAFAHPAKFSLALIERIYDHMIDRGWLRPGDVVGDPFGGVGIGGLVATYRKLHWIGCELEPKFVTLAEQNFAFHRHKFAALSLPYPIIYRGDSRQFYHCVQSVVTSPPYCNSLSSGGGNNIDYSKSRDGGKRVTPVRKASGEGYGKEVGQIDTLPAGSVDACISSPPYAQSLRGLNHNGIAPEKLDPTKHHTGQSSMLLLKQSYGKSEGQIEKLPEGSLAACVSSPPYASISAGAGGLNTKPAKPGQQGGRSAKSASQTADQKYGNTPGQISQLSGLVTSPPWESNCEGGVRKGKLKAPPSSGKGNYGSPEAHTAQLERDEAKNYGDTAGNIGNTQKETYWDAMRTVYEQCFIALRPGGYMAIVVKDYCKDRKIVPLCDDTARLLKHIGFRIVERAHAMLVNETTEADLFAGSVTTRRERKSFFRRLYEKGGGPRIDFEQVLFAKKPIQKI